MVGGGGAMRALTTMTTKQGNKGTDNKDNKTAINKCAVAEAEDKDGWQEAGHGGGGGGAAVMQRRRRNSFVIRSWRMEVEVRQGFIPFFFLVGLNPSLNPTSTNPAQNLGIFFIFSGVGVGRI